ncbi:hypothetical protein NKJ59_02570 [Mesorhizobium australicum]|uniref:hypothetical protein n=1 Tax=Mesorhizobium australicum TaxID=536018 RepID=UPI00333AF996
MPKLTFPAAGEAMPAVEEMHIITGRFSRRAMLIGLASIPALAGATAAVTAPTLPATDEAEINRLIASYRRAKQAYDAACDIEESMPDFSAEAMAASDAVDVAWNGYRDAFDELLEAPCSTMKAVQMKAAVLVNDKEGYSGDELEYDEARILLRSFLPVQS